MFLVLAGGGLAAIRFVGASPVEDGVEGALGSFALGAPVMATGVLAVLALWDRAVLLLPAAVVLVPMSFLSLSPSRRGRAWEALGRSEQSSAGAAVHAVEDSRGAQPPAGTVAGRDRAR